MKKLRNYVIALILIVSTINAGITLGMEGSLHVNVVGKKQIDLHLNQINGKVRMFLADKEGNIHFEEKMKVKDEVKINLDLTDIEEGTYTLMVRDEQKLQSVPVIVGADDVTVKMVELSKTFFPKVEVENKRLTVKMLSNPSNDLSVRIHSTEGELLFEEKFEGVTGLIAKQFKFLPGHYQIELLSDNYSAVKYYSFQ